MNSKITMGSLFDGIGGFPLAALKNQINPVWASAFPDSNYKRAFPFNEAFRKYIKYKW